MLTLSHIASRPPKDAEEETGRVCEATQDAAQCYTGSVADRRGWLDTTTRDATRHSQAWVAVEGERRIAQVVEGQARRSTLRRVYDGDTCGGLDSTIQRRWQEIEASWAGGGGGKEAVGGWVGGSHVFFERARSLTVSNLKVRL